MSIIFRYFYFVGILVGLVNVIIGKYNVQHLVNEHLVTQTDLNNFLLGYLCFLVIPTLLLGIIQILGKFDSPFYIYLENLSNKFVISGYSVIFIWSFGFISWLWFGHGAEIMIRFRDAFNNIPDNAQTLRIYMTIAMILGLVFLGIWRLPKLRQRLQNMSHRFNASFD